MVDAVDVWDDFEVLALYFDLVDLFFPSLVLDLDEVGPVVGLFDSGLDALVFVDQLNFNLFYSKSYFFISVLC